ncbi:hypothetical protein K3495_g10692 [Podosphaera aphanis]|nr:hypothetical protein K3495_g10692 [Podosphaera aphanis]
MYGSPIWAETATSGNIPERIVKPLRSIQSKCLQKVTGAYKSTSTRVLEHETSTLPVEIYLKKSRVQHAGLTQNLPIQKTIENSCRKIRRQVYKHETSNYSLSKERDRTEWTRISEGEESIKGQKEMGKTAAFQEWANSWPHQPRNTTLRHRVIADPEFWKAANFTTDKTTGRKKVSLRGSPYSVHKNLKRAQSSLAMQIRSEHIGLNYYLYRRKVPGVDNQSYPCGYRSQNVKHVIMACPYGPRGEQKSGGRPRIGHLKQ